ncbi:ComF family protein [Massilia yuzhufengensis]|uniref:ComF family protein n=1 Tax=Massilia yuzhufengensis TaxID=1164594 RepID=A0A1I1W5L6_9BURK|nr:ComF family protein [Massilia yuzhufengensis]SFD88633.1 comF family protein [Massilia yuzhufengensis]
MTLLSRLSRWPGALLGALLPSSCVLCGATGDEPVCAACSLAYAGDAHARCPCCANPVGASDAGRRCGACVADPPAYDATLAACDYAVPVDQLVLQLKFSARLALAPWMARRLHAAALARQGLVLPDVLCPVPLGPRRLAERGYNQALEVARPLAASLGVMLAPRLVERLVETRAQSGVAPNERLRNVRGAFAVAQGQAALLGRHVGVVDDVMTSGHTLDELAGVLKRAGAARVTNFVFARTPPH